MVDYNSSTRLPTQVGASQIDVHGEIGKSSIASFWSSRATMSIAKANLHRNFPAKQLQM